MGSWLSLFFIPAQIGANFLHMHSTEAWEAYLVFSLASHTLRLERKGLGTVSTRICAFQPKSVGANQIAFQLISGIPTWRLVCIFKFDELDDVITTQDHIRNKYY